MTSAGCGEAGAQTGTYDAMIMSSGRPRTFTVTAPADYDADAPHRVIFGFHGRDGDGRRVRPSLDLERYSDGKVIFVYPWAEQNQGYIGWKLGSFTSRYGGEDDLPFFDDMLDSLRESYCIDSSRVVVTGQGWGGDMTHLVSCMRGTAVRAGIGVAANGTYYMPPRAGLCTGNPDIFTLHAVGGDGIPLSQGEALRDFWVREHDCQTASSAVQPDRCMEFTDCTARTVWCPYDAGNGGQQLADWYSRTAMDWFLAY
jgi:poly(3-hydroxybutyrate) depolymerase